MQDVEKLFKYSFTIRYDIDSAKCIMDDWNMELWLLIWLWKERFYNRTFELNTLMFKNHYCDKKDKTENFNNLKRIHAPYNGKLPENVWANIK